MEKLLDGPKRFSFLRGLGLADYMTLANGVAGVGAVLGVLAYLADGHRAHLALAYLIVGAAMVSKTLRIPKP